MRFASASSCMIQTLLQYGRSRKIKKESIRSAERKGGRGPQIIQSTQGIHYCVQMDIFFIDLCYNLFRSPIYRTHPQKLLTLLDFIVLIYTDSIDPYSVVSLRS